MIGADQRQAVVIGAGLAGLVTATALARSGWSVRVHERAEELRMFGAGIWLWENGLTALRQIGVPEATILEHGQSLSAWEIRDHRNRLVRRRVATPGDRLVVPRREDLYAELITAAAGAGVDIVTNSQADSVHPDGTVSFVDGTTYRAGLVVAADGVRSRLRHSLGLTQRFRGLGVGARRMLIPRLASEADADVAIENWSRRRSFLYNPVSRNEIYICFVSPLADTAAVSVPLDKDTWIRSFPHMAEAIDRVTDEGRWDEVSTVECSSWRRGKVAIVGDAAHALPPTLGQAANLAFANAVALATIVTPDRDVTCALAEWETRLRPTTDHTQRWSKLYNALSHVWPTPMEGLKVATFKHVTRVPYVDRSLNRAARTPPIGVA